MADLTTADLTTDAAAMAAIFLLVRMPPQCATSICTTSAARNAVRR